MMSEINRNQTLETRGLAVGMVLAGSTTREAAKAFGVSQSAVSKWMKKHQQGQSLSDKPRSGRPKVLDRVSKIVLAKSLTKKRQSTRKLATRLTAAGHQVSRNTVHRYLVKNLGCKAFVQRKIPKITEKQRKDRLKFCTDRRNWTVADWSKVIFSDESPFELDASPNHQNDRIWAHSPTEIQNHERNKFPGKLMVWGGMSAKGITKLHVVPNKTSINAEYYHGVILKEYLLPVYTRTKSTGKIEERKLVDSMLDSIFQQDNATCHTAQSTTAWLQRHNITVMGKGVWPANSPDLNPIENLWSILEEELKCEKKTPQDLPSLEKALQAAWSRIKPETLTNLILSMPDRIKSVIKARGKFVIRK